MGEPSDAHLGRRRNYEIARLRLARLRARGGVALVSALTNACEVAAATLDVERVGIWLFDHDRSEIRCGHLFERSKRAHSEGVVLRRVDIPTYFRALEERRYICADDARTHALTRELTESYLVPLGIGSMLDAPIYRDGTVIGVVCHEHVGSPRRWTTEERDFSASVADNLSLMSEEAARAEAEERARTLQQQALELEKVKALSQLAAGTAHDVRNLVSVVRWAARSIGGDPQSTPENVERADRILGATESVMAIVRDLEALGRDVAREPRVLDPVVELTRLLPLLRAAVGEQCTVSMRCAGNIGFVLVDRVQFERLVFNLVINARESMPNGGPVELELSETKIGDGDGDGEPDSHGVHVVFAVRDAGTGISPEVLERVFDPFFTTKPPGAGSGLGLTVVYAVADRFGGFVHVESEPGAGTTFRIYLPRVSARDEELEQRV